MKNGSVQRASKRSYMDEATLASVTKGLDEIRAELARVDQIHSATSGGLAELVAGLDRSLRGTMNSLCERVATLESTVANLAAIVESVVIASDRAAGVDVQIETKAEPNCDHGFIGSCAECDGSGQIPDAELVASEVA